MRFENPTGFRHNSRKNMRTKSTSLAVQGLRLSGFELQPRTLHPETSVLAKDDADPLKLIPVSKLWLSVIRILHPAAISPKSLTLTFPKALDPTR